MILRDSLYGVKGFLKVSLMPPTLLPRPAQHPSPQVADWQAISRRIREARESLGWTQAQLGRAVGSSANYVAQVEGGLGISEAKLARYGAALGRSVPWLRYGVADGVDVETLRRVAREEARLELLAELDVWMAAARLTSHPRPADLPAAEETPATDDASRPQTDRAAGGR